MRRAANTQGATEIGQARLANAADEAGLRNEDLNLRLQNLSLPYAIAQQGANLENMPENIALENQARRLEPFNFFRLQQQQYNSPPAPQVQPVANTGQIVAQGIGALGNAASQYSYNQQLMNQARQYQNPNIYPSPMSALGA